ncbi:MAG TPA: helix-turn-helix domain-containing protein [Rhizomicrobium sp.]|jgi:putative transcriptional regulator|nr:helix-turn-helix domain-containing protein [Rhizomicrobium sp.]
MTIITARTRKSDGKLVRIHDDGREEVLEAPPIRPMSEEEIEAAALSDPDNPPRAAAELAKMKRVPRAKTLRRALRLTQEEFALRYHIPLGTLRDWEQGRSEPDQPARAYLAVIARDPEGIAKAFEKKPFAAE